jgi:hypothetical protein
MERLCKLAKTMSVATQKPSVALSNEVCLRFLAQLTGCIAEVIDDGGDEQARDEEIEFNSHGLDGEQVEKLVLPVREPAYDLFYQFNTETTKCFWKICTNHGIFKPCAFAFRIQGDTLFGEIVAIIEHKESARTFAVIEKHPQETISWLNVESSLYENHMVDFAALYKDRQYNSNGRPLERDFITVSLYSVGGQIELVPFPHGEVSQQVKRLISSIAQTTCFLSLVCLTVSESLFFCIHRPI